MKFVLEKKMIILKNFLSAPGTKKDAKRIDTTKIKKKWKKEKPLHI